jgi:hypothetical protein
MMWLKTVIVSKDLKEKIADLIDVALAGQERLIKKAVGETEAYLIYSAEGTAAIRQAWQEAIKDGKPLAFHLAEGAAEKRRARQEEEARSRIFVPVR